MPEYHHLYYRGQMVLLLVMLLGFHGCAGNILVRKGADGSWELVPIDHGYVLPDSFQDISFEWLYWPQARATFGEFAIIRFKLSSV